MAMLDRYLRFPWNFEISHDKLFGLEFSRMMHITMKQIATQNGHARPFFRVSRNFEVSKID